MTDIDRRLLLGLAGAAGATLAAKLAQGGSLNPPPGPVAPTGKTTEQIEPRIDLLNAPASANVTSEATVHYIINNPGSYYLSGNLAVSKSFGIYINAPDVTLDLCGFSIYRSSGSGGTGVAAYADYEMTLRNGVLRGFDFAVDANVGGRLEDLRAVDCATGFSIATGCAWRCLAFNCAQTGFEGSYADWFECTAIGGGKGFAFGENCACTRCIAEGCNDVAFGGLTGCMLDDCIARAGVGDAAAAFQFGDNCKLTGCVAVSNVAAIGFSVGGGCILQDCVADANTSASAISGGFRLQGSVARDCVANAQATAASGPTESSGYGFFAAQGGSLFEGCLARSNAGAGFVVGSSSVATRNVAVSNGFAGIHANGANASIESNRVVANGGNGILVTGSVNLVFANCARNNTAGNYSIVASNRVGTIVVPAVTASAINGNVGGSAFTTDPYANIAF